MILAAACCQNHSPARAGPPTPLRAEKREAEEAKQKADFAEQSAEAETRRRLEPQLAALEQVHAALVRWNWPGASRSRRGPFRVQCVAEMAVTEIAEQTGDHETGFREITAKIMYFKYPGTGEALIQVRAGTYSVFSEKRIGHVRLIGGRWRQLTPELIKRAAARYCITRKVEFSLE